MSGLPPEVTALIDALEVAASSEARRWTNTVDGSVMIRIPPGSGPLGYQNDLGRVALGGFSLARHPVTNAQFDAFLKATGYAPPEDHPRNDDFLKHWGGSLAAEIAHHPVVFVSWVDALHYCQWAGLMLPSEWCWERAARGLDGRLYPWGNQQPSPKNKLANLFARSTVAVGSFPGTRTAYGCQDMIGDVSEWCVPVDALTALPAVLDPPAIGEVPELVAVRGSAYMRVSRREGRMQAAHRRSLSPTRRNHWTGFRPAMSEPTD